MKRLTIALAGAWLLAQGSASAESVDDIVAKNIKALGGADKIAAIQSLRLTAKITVGGGDFHWDADWASLRKRPGMTRSEFFLQGLTQITAYDSKDAWSVDPFEGRRDAVRGSVDDAKQGAQDADFDGILVDWKKKGHKVEALGTEDVDGTQA